jgi:hypothetical protein
MPQNYDIIEIIASGESGGCNCTAADFSNDFVVKTNGTFITSLGSTDTSWSPYSFVLGGIGSSTKSTLTVQGNANDKAEIISKSPSSQSIVYPDKIKSPRFETTTGNTIITDAQCNIGNTTLGGNLVPSTNNVYSIGSTGNRIQKTWTVDADVSGTMTIVSLSPTTLSVGGASTFTDLATFNGNIAVPGTSTLGIIAGTTATIGTGTFTTSVTSPTGTFTNATVATAPSANTDIVRRQDVYVTTNPTLALGLHKIQVAGGFITNVQTANGADLPTHVGRHHTTTRTTNAPAAGQGGDGLNAYDIGAVERANPVVSKPLKITTTVNHTYSTAVPYFIVINAGSEPDSSGPEGQIIFRKAQA